MLVAGYMYFFPPPDLPAEFFSYFGCIKTLKYGNTFTRHLLCFFPHAYSAPVSQIQVCK